eukprot:TRINITY_DN10404_c0_g1_i2.p2 TRINITY_DN10404_c0_g1~~TRINITY_DN10404_c0_g1_i2.p2  ORF type:complete len:134 (-),score=16.62 TRINITY_DN10404_c0_g1_i2:239-640(-)
MVGECVAYLSSCHAARLPSMPTDAWQALYNRFTPSKLAVDMFQVIAKIDKFRLMLQQNFDESRRLLSCSSKEVAPAIHARLREVIEEDRRLCCQRAELLQPLGLDDSVVPLSFDFEDVIEVVSKRQRRHRKKQ